MCELNELHDKLILIILVIPLVLNVSFNFDSVIFLGRFLTHNLDIVL